MPTIRRFALRTGLAATAAATGLATLAPSAFAGEQWCDFDPIQLLITSGGKIVPIFVTNGAGSLLYLPQLALAKITSSTQSADGGKSTLVTVNVTVPNGLLGKKFAARTVVSALLLGLGKVYGTATGSSGSTMTVQFKLPIG